MKFVICILAVLTSSFATKFDFDGVLKCDNPKKWCYTVEAKEVDLISNDYITEYRNCRDPSKISTNPLTIDQNFMGKDHGKYNMTGDQDDDGILDNYFEIALFVTHNCTGTEQYIYDDNFEEVPVTSASFRMTKNFNLETNRVMP